MKNILPLLTLICLVLLGTNCKDDDDASPNYNTSETGEYFPLAVGNYWIYEEERFNTSAGSGTQTGRIDTLRVIDQKQLAGIDFFVLENTYLQGGELRKTISYLRDSSGYLIDQRGRTHFSAVALDQILETHEFSTFIDITIEYKVQDSVIIKVTDAGVFPCLDFKGHVYQEGLLTESANHNYYSKGVGRVWNSFSYVSSPNMELRYLLKEYYVQ